MSEGPVVVCDPGVDDLLALMVSTGLGHSPRAIVGTAGNVDAEVAYHNAAGITALLGLDSPVARGVDTGREGPYPDTGDPFHGADGLGGIASLLPQPSSPTAFPEPIQLIEGPILAIGALTIVAEAIDAGRPLTEIVWMGGAVACGGNITAAAEFNAWLDPEAADRVVSSTVPLSMIPLDVTLQVTLTPDDLNAMAGLGKIASLAARACSHFHHQGDSMVPHDAVAAVAQLHPELFDWEQHWVRCELDGRWTRGMTVVDRRQNGMRGPVRVALGVDQVAVKDKIFEALRLLA